MEQSGQVVVKTTTREVLHAKERTTPKFWTYLEGPKPTGWDRHILYIYRTDPAPPFP